MEATLGPLASLHACHCHAAVTLTILTDADRLKQAPERSPTPNTRIDTSPLSLLLKISIYWKKTMSSLAWKLYICLKKKKKQIEYNTNIYMMAVFITPTLVVGCCVSPEQRSRSRKWADGSRTAAVHQTDPKGSGERMPHRHHRRPLLLHYRYAAEELAQVHRSHRGRELKLLNVEMNNSFFPTWFFLNVVLWRPLPVD